MKSVLMMRKELIAPCGMNCVICGRYLAMKYDVKSQGVRMPYCAGCRVRGKQCAYLKKPCGSLLNNSAGYCHKCAGFPCGRLGTIDARYRKRYRMSMIENLRFIKSQGLKKFLAREKKKWRCRRCGGIICCHNGLCFSCDLHILKKKKQKYRWSTALRKAKAEVKGKGSRRTGTIHVSLQ
ncbi:MAG: DUF3795 domain-containing protein [Candidatus Aureabacteria bacterium]|nr:DUF3795 domain-containing protein [Candidatus Auribacterota bacterium]